MTTALANAPATVQRAVENSTEFAARRLVAGAPLQVYSDFTPKEIADLIAERKKVRADNRTALDELLTRKTTAIQAAVDADESTDFDALLNDAPREALELVQAVVKGFVDDYALARQHADALKPIMEEEAVKAENLVDKVKRELEKIGSGLDAMQADPQLNPDAAQRQFDHLARNRNTRSRAALARAGDARSAYSAAVEKLGEITDRLSAARALLQRMAFNAAIGKS